MIKLEPLTPFLLLYSRLSSFFRCLDNGINWKNLLGEETDKEKHQINIVGVINHSMKHPDVSANI